MGVGAGLYMCDVVKKKFTFAISSPDEFLYKWSSNQSAGQKSCYSALRCNKIFRPHRSTTYVDATYSYRPSIAWSVGRSVFRSVTLVSPAKTAAPIKLPFGLRTWLGPGNHVLDGGSRSPEGKRQIFGGEWASHCKV